MLLAEHVFFYKLYNFQEIKVTNLFLLSQSETYLTSLVYLIWLADIESIDYLFYTYLFKVDCETSYPNLY